jgi:UDP-2-acetamido-2-deoxy-ribo-hexuluronate aminotransferase
LIDMKFCDLNAQYDAYKEEIQLAINQVLESTAFINGPAVKTLGEDLSSFSGVKHSVPCASGTDALLLAFMALNVKPGDEIIVPAFTFIATGSMISFYKAVPVFVDVDPVTFNINPKEIKNKITDKTVGIIPVSLYGQCAPMNEINKIAVENNLWVIEDAAQSFGADYKNKKSCNLSTMATTSFFPAKPLGCYGDGGAVFTNNDTLAEKVRLYANHGQAKRYYHSEIGINGRMDSIQAAVVCTKLKHFDNEIDARNRVAAMYTERLKGIVQTPEVLPGNRSTWAQYTIRSGKRDLIKEKLSAMDIPTAIHYPMPLPRQEAFSYLQQNDKFPVSDMLSEQVLSLPMHAFIKEEEIDLICNTIKKAVR